MVSSKRLEKIQKIVSVTAQYAVKSSVPITGAEYFNCDYDDMSKVPGGGAGWKSFAADGFWGGKPDSHAWFRFDVTVPACGKRERTQLNFRTEIGGWAANNPQFIVYLNGDLVQGLDTNHTYVIVPEGRHSVHLYAYSGMLISGRLRLFAALDTVCLTMERLSADLSVPLQTAYFTDEESYDYEDTLSALNAAVNFLDFRKPYSEEFYSSADKAIEYLEKNFYNNGRCSQSVACVGHTHIDAAWLWTARQSEEKAVRSFSTVLELMKRYPQYSFFSSQPALYKMVKEKAPALYKKIKRAVKAGRWEADGAMWVEADCNLISGESMVRQILKCKHFFKREFGVDSKILWLPDVFGYSAAMPQILKKSGIDSFVTSKISWNDTNRMPYDAFSWKGIDGSEVFTYFITAQDATKERSTTQTLYVTQITPAEAAGALKRFNPKGLSGGVMLLYGWGDGGGGPTSGMIENIIRMQKGFGNFPRASFKSARAFLDGFKSGMDESLLPKWSGELYLELHRGTYTSIAKNKRNNRKSEFLLHNLELLFSLSKLLLKREYPSRIIEGMWEKVLFNQFHDILPGTSIERVYQDTDKDYAGIFESGGTITEKELSALAGNLNTDGGLLVFNPHGFPFSGEVRTESARFMAENVPPLGYKVVSPIKSASLVSVSDGMLESPFLRIRFDKNYEIVSVFDKLNYREIIKAGNAANKLIAYEDLPHVYDAWEIEDYYREKAYALNGYVSCEKITDGSRAGYKITRNFIDSVIEQKILLRSDASAIDFETVADWKEEHILLRTEFPVEINACEAVYDIQFGAIKRPAHANTSWDQAKFEVCGHKFADYSEYGYGVALVTDSKYGYSVREGVMGLSLLKCATDPNPNADKGIHTFSYSLMPHKGDYRKAGIARAAYIFNNPPPAVRVKKSAGALPPEFSLLSASSDAIIIETVKTAESGEGTIARAYEQFGGSCAAKLKCGLRLKRVILCDMLENEIEPLAVENGDTIGLDFKPFEIHTIKLYVE